MRRHLPVFITIVFILICYVVLARFAAPSDAFGKNLRGFKVADLKWPQLAPEEPPVKQPAAQEETSSKPTPQPVSAGNKQQPSVKPEQGHAVGTPAGHSHTPVKVVPTPALDDKQQESPTQPPINTPPAQTGDNNNQVPPTPGGAAIPLLVNKENGLPPTYVPPDLTVPAIPFSFTEDLPKKLMSAPAARALEKLFAAAQADGIELVGVSAYRSYQTQQAVFQQHVDTSGPEEAERISAPPGYSEHQTGLAIDVSSPSVDNLLVEEFGETQEGRWLAANAPQYGFIVRYPRDKEAVTGYQYEPWHIRYVGEQFAPAIAARGMTLEEYLNDRMIARN